MGNCVGFAAGNKDEVKAVGVWSFLNGEDGVWFRRDEDGSGKNPKRLGKTAKRTTTRMRAMADEGMGNGFPAHNAFQNPTLPLAGAPHLSPQPLMHSMGGGRLRGPFAQSLSAAVPEPDCNGVEDFVALVLVFMLAFMSLKKFRRIQKTQKMQEPLMDA